MAAAAPAAKSAAKIRGEVIRFVRPGSDCVLACFGLPNWINENILREHFARFGLLHSVVVKREGSRPFAFVTFFSESEARRAQIGMNGFRLWNGSPLSVLSRYRAEQDNQKRRLALRSCFRVANHFIGFNRWNCRVMGVEPYDDDRKEHRNALDAESFAPLERSLTARQSVSVATTRVEVPGNKIVVEGRGAGVAFSQGDASKIAVTNAYRHAFQQLAVVRIERVRAGKSVWVSCSFRESSADAS